MKKQKMYRIEQYNSNCYKQWNDFIDKSKNGTFLFHRDFMEYHSDRFEDFSLLVFDENKLVAVLPANRVQDVVYSHQGLTYGGLIYSEKIKLSDVIAVFRSVLKFCHENGVAKLHLKITPYIYHKLPSQELEYALFLANAKLTRRDSLAVIENAQKIKIASNRIEGVKKGIANALKVIETNDFTSFWNKILIPNLVNKFGVKPVHSLEEISLLKERFPDNIKHYIVLKDEEIVAGTVLFESDMVIHAQYISAGESKNELGSLDFLYHHLITNAYTHKKYFDFGISNEEQGRKINGGLQFWKEGFGARTVVQDFYETETNSYNLLLDVSV